MRILVILGLLMGFASTGSASPKEDVQQLDPAFRTKIDKLRVAHKAKVSFLDRLSGAGI